MAADRLYVGSWRRSLTVAALPLLLSRLVVWGAGVAALLLLGPSARAAGFDPAGVTEPFGAIGDLLVAPATRWDSAWLLAIAESGYGGDRAAFFPLYPLLLRTGGAIVGSPLVAGILISCACALAALAVLHRLVALDFGDEAARLSVALVAWFPTSLFLSAVYSEALFLLLSLAAVYAARTDRWAWAGALGGLAAMTRSAGVVLLVPLVLLWLGGRHRHARSLAWLALVPLGLGTFSLALALAGHDPLAPLRAQGAWMREFAGPLGAVPPAVARAGEDAGNALLLATLVAVAVALAGALRRLPPAYGLYAAVALLLPLSYPVAAQPLMSLPRFVLVLWPLHLWLALVLVRRRRAARAVLVASAAGLGVVAAQFATWHWVA